MNATPRRSIFVAFIISLLAVPFAPAQTTPFRPELLSLMPEDFGVCVVMRDLKGHYARWEKSAWFKTFRASPLGQQLLAAPELRQMERWLGELQRNLGLDWPTLRDDILGDTVILAYSPGPKDQPSKEEGLILVQVRHAERFAQFIDRLNDLQTKSGDLKSLTRLEHDGLVYHRREEKTKSQFYAIHGSLVALTSQEEVMKAFLVRRSVGKKDDIWEQRFQRAGAGEAFLTLCVNPRRIEPDLGPNLKRGDPLPSYWRALDGIFATLTLKDEAEVRITLQANVDLLPHWGKSVFTKTAPASALWSHFPEPSILTIAARLDIAGTVDGLLSLLPEKDRGALMAAVRNNVKAILELDPFDDVLPNIGPDWGVCVLPADRPSELPRVLAAIAIQPGKKKPPVDQALFSALRTFAGFAVLEHNSKNPDAVIRLQSLMQDNVEVRTLMSDKAFPAGLQPACALKDGFLVFASTPDAILRFGKVTAPSVPRDETPLLRLSTRELAALLQHRREHVLHKLPEASARQHLDNVIAILKTLDHVTLSQRGENGQSSWILRIAPAK